ncbi:MAG: alpha/beta hydrolase [Cellvibrionaceae bacterium]
MTLDPQAKAFLDKVNSMGNEPIHTLGAEKARIVYAARPDYLAPEKVELFKVVDQTISTPQYEIPVRIYTPVKPNTSLPVMVFYHGGGMVIGTLDGYDTLCRQLAMQSGCIVVSVDYRLAPEHKFPSAVDDAYGALTWVVNNAVSLGGDPQKIAVGGDSAGGSLAAVVAILARDQQLVTLKYQLLIYPATASHADSDSQLRLAEGYFLERETILWFHKSYIRSDKDREDFRYAPLITEDLRGLPPAMVLVAGYDPLRDEGIAYAKCLSESGVRVQLSEYKGMFHPFLSFAGVLDEGKRAISECSRELKQAMAN